MDYLNEAYQLLKYWYRRDNFDFRSVIRMLNKSHGIVNVVMENSPRRTDIQFDVLIGGEQTYIEYNGNKATIWLDALTFSKEWWKIFGVDTEQYNPGLLALGVGIATIFHETLHARFTQFNDKDDAYRLSKLSLNSSERNIWNLICNVVEDNYINNIGIKLYESYGEFLYLFTRFLIEHNPTFKGSFKSDPLKMEDAIGACQFVAGGLTYNENRNLTNGNSLKGLLDIASEVLTLSQDSSPQLRIDIADRIYEYIYDPNGVSSFDQQQVQKQTKIGKPQIGKGDKDEESNSRNFGKDYSKLSSEEKSLIQHIAVDVENELKGVGTDHHQQQYTLKMQDPPNERVRLEKLNNNLVKRALTLLRKLKYQVTSADKSFASDSGSKLNNRGLSDSGTIFLKYQERKMNEKPLNIILLIDQSGSMTSYSFNKVVAQHALEWWEAITNLGLKCWVYNHTTEYQVCLVTRILNPNTPKNRALELIQRALSVDERNNLDAQAVLAVIADTKKQRDGKTVVLVMSDGQPNSVGGISGESALKQLVSILPKQNIELWGCALKEEVIESNRSIYGENCIDASSNLDKAIQEFVTKMIGKR